MRPEPAAKRGGEGCGEREREVKRRQLHVADRESRERDLREVRLARHGQQLLEWLGGSSNTDPEGRKRRVGVGESVGNGWGKQTRASSKREPRSFCAHRRCGGKCAARQASGRLDRTRERSDIRWTGVTLCMFVQSAAIYYFEYKRAS